MKSQFSLLYDGQPFRAEIDTENAILNQWELASDVTVTADVKAYQKYDAAEWVLFFENKGSVPSKVISDIWDCDSFLPLDVPEWKPALHMPDSNSLCLITMNGPILTDYYWYDDKASAEEFQFHYEYLEKIPKHLRRYANRGGRSSDEIMPFFDVTANGAGYIVAIGWTGDWKTEFVGSREGVTARVGLKHTGFYLKPNEKVRTSSVLVMKYTSEEDRYNKFRGLMRDYYSPKTGNGLTQNNLCAFSFWGAVPSEEMKKRIREIKEHDIEFDHIWIDAGWFGEHGKGGWSNLVGNWSVNKEEHPGDLVDVSEEISKAGMGFMFWLEPERVKTNVALFEEHPDWCLSIPDQMSEHGDHILNYGHPEAWQYVFDLLSGYIEKLDLKCYRQDFNIEMTPFFEGCDEENRIGITQIKHIMGMYELWDRLLERYPDLIIDNCASGGRRIDIETLKRSIPLFRTDYLCNYDANPDVNQAHSTNLFAYLPSVGCTTHRKADTYSARSSYSTSWAGSFYGNTFQSMSEEDFAWARKTVNEYKRIRRYFSRDFYNHGSSVFDPASWTIWQFYDPETEKGILMLFRREQSPCPSVEISLKGIGENAKLQFENLDTAEKWSGTKDLTVSLKDKRSSVIIEYAVTDYNS